jgi:hypothetical protein
MFDFNHFGFNRGRAPHVRNSKGFAGGTKAESRLFGGSVAGATRRCSQPRAAARSLNLE